MTQEDLTGWTQLDPVTLATAPGFSNISYFVSNVRFDNYSGLGSATMLDISVYQFTDRSNATAFYERGLSGLLSSTNETTGTNMTVSAGDRSFAIHQPLPDHETEIWRLISQQRNAVVTIAISSPYGTEGMYDQVRSIAEAQNNKIFEHLE